MITIYEVDCDKAVIAATLHRIVGQIYKLLPMNEEGKDWMKPLETLITELVGMFHLLPDLSTGLAALSKLEGIKQQGDNIEFSAFRRAIFECCTLISKLEKELSE